MWGRISCVQTGNIIWFPLTIFLWVSVCETRRQRSFLSFRGRHCRPTVGWLSLAIIMLMSRRGAERVNGRNATENATLIDTHVFGWTAQLHSNGWLAMSITMGSSIAQGCHFDHHYTLSYPPPFLLALFLMRKWYVFMELIYYMIPQMSHRNRTISITMARIAEEWFRFIHKNQDFFLPLHHCPLRKQEKWSVKDVWSPMGNRIANFRFRRNG